METSYRFPLVNLTCVCPPVDFGDKTLCIGNAHLDEEQCHDSKLEE